MCECAPVDIEGTPRGSLLLSFAPEGPGIELGWLQAWQQAPFPAGPALQAESLLFKLRLF